MPKVTIKRVRSEPRKMVNAHRAPKQEVVAMAKHKPTKGSGMMCLANNAAE